MAPNPPSDVSSHLALVGDDDPRQILRSTPSRIAALVAHADAATRAWKPTDTAWSIDEIVAHLADAELVTGFRLRMAATSDGVELQAFDEKRWAATFEYASLDAAESAQLFAAYRRGTLGMLDRLAPELLDHQGVHQERGVETIRHAIRLAAGHDRHHIQQIERNLAGAAGHPTPFAPAAPKPEVPLDLAERLDLRVGTIVAIDEVPRADRLMRLTVDFGGGTRHVIAGIRQERRDPRALVGRQALFYYNLPARTIRGQESHGMLCDVGYGDGLRPALLEPEWPVPNGARAG